ncbi:MAG: hypothetical protein A2374_05325 [Candidatus Moranbacteria bacterium RIFOXYB1_FULL_44_23]|nr:MAG: hypothetical protein A2194_03885 [Candidatus Moranbacteria bacterium RIFOXYA1_FULL_44_8]OGI40181.1 MAG: hypothetical protein A2374_05325 [Candidatus Moranbacteria bacterium RIFOXYB1_FULL_44_23]HBB37252.1 hypothetical protein [Candidatus Moranbacteria bacterium]HBU25184.1 hypothetical protein [Candidatus Moranbacteria bacterium]
MILSYKVDKVRSIIHRSDSYLIHPNHKLLFSNFITKSSNVPFWYKNNPVNKGYICRLPLADKLGTLDWGRIKQQFMLFQNNLAIQI